MLPSPDQEISNTSSGASQSSKGLTQKASSGGLQIPKKKNGKEKGNGGGNGILAAVTKNASKMSNTKSSGQSSGVQSPELNPVGSPPNGNTITSPLLDALSSAAALDGSPSQNANEWAKNIPEFSSSPNNLINLGESPPVPPYEDRLANFGWTTREQRGIAASPPARRKPLSYQLDGNYPPVFDDHRSQISSYAARRSSMYSQHPRYAQHPPLPHHAQAHFYGAPDANLLLSPPMPGLIPGDNGYYCGFDSLVTGPQDVNKSTNNVVVSGYEGGVKVYSISRRGLTKISSIDGLRGGVYNAKVLPWTAQGGDSHHFPLIAMVIHGPVWPSSDASSGEGSTPPSEAVSITHNDSVRGSPRIVGPAMNDGDPIEHYQTAVEIYSLSTKQHVATLLSIPKVHLSMPTTSPLFKAPLPVGSLTIRADSGYVVIASGTTGETWLFRQADSTASPDRFRCIGKIWTTVQHGESVTSSGLPDAEWHAPDPNAIRKQYKASILSMSGRWLAYCPPTPSSQTSLRAAVPGVGSTTRIPGLNGYAPPQLPGVNCGVDMPDGESMMKQLVQISTQKFIEAGNYLTQQGLQAWNNYMNKPTSNHPSNGTPPYQNHASMPQQFPPTHGLPTPAPLITKDPGLLSILDLESLAHHSSTGSTPHPLATFRVPHGCSFLSFAPSGLALFTASSKGDVQFVWDLMRIQYAKSSFLKGGPRATGAIGPHVRQIAQFSRMTIARIVDVVWTSPHGERAAMVTEPGTVHILDLPASAFTWPPPRRRSAPHKFDESVGDSGATPLTASGVASSAVNTLWTAARPLVSQRRRSSAGISARTVTAQAGHGTQALAAGISRSVGAATGKMNEMRKAGTTKLHLPRSPAIPSRACVLLLNGKRNDSIIAVGGGVVRLYTIKNRRADRPADRQKASRGAKYVEFRLPSLPDFKFSPDITRNLHQVGDLELTESDIEESRWKSRQASPPAPQTHGTESSIPQAEIESNAPYQPFHTDRRVALHVYSYEEEEDPLLSPSALISLATPSKSRNTGGLNKPWAFGGLMKSTKLDVGPPHNPDDEFDLPIDYRALPSSAIERVMKVTDSTEEVEQIVITTRRRKGISRITPDGIDDGDEEGFFEDDCEVLDFASQRV